MRLLILSSFIFVLQACGQDTTSTVSADSSSTVVHEDASTLPLIDTSGMTVQTRFNPPEGFERITAEESSFASYLRNLPLKKAGALVKYYDGGLKSNYGVYEAVIDLPIGTRNLHQCADAVMRLKAEYLWTTGQYDQIHFNFTNGFRVDYSEWMKGKRMVVKGNKTYWVAGAARQIATKNSGNTWS